ncbi:MAG: hypothetical protein AAF092_12530 [Pseudomonadota bacterium]
MLKTFTLTLFAAIFSATGAFAQGEGDKSVDGVAFRIDIKADYIAQLDYIVFSNIYSRDAEGAPKNLAISGKAEVAAFLEDYPIGQVNRLAAEEPYTNLALVSGSTPEMILGFDGFVTDLRGPVRYPWDWIDLEGNVAPPTCGITKNMALGYIGRGDDTIGQYVVNVFFKDAASKPPFDEDKTQIKIPRIVRSGTADGPIRIDTYSDGEWTGYNIYRGAPGTSNVYMNREAVVAGPAATTDWRITFMQSAQLVFSTAKLEGNWVADVKLGEMTFGGSTPGAQPSFRRFESGGHVLDLHTWQARCGQPFEFTLDQYATGVQSAREYGDRLTISAGTTRNFDSVETASWFRDVERGGTAKLDMYYSDVGDNARFAFTGMRFRHGSRPDPVTEGNVPIEATHKAPVIKVDAWEGPAGFDVFTTSTGSDSPNRIALLGTRLEVRPGNSDVLATLETGVQSGFTYPLLNGSIPKNVITKDNGFNIMASELPSGSWIYGYLNAFAVDVPFGIAQ